MKQKRETALSPDTRTEIDLVPLSTRALCEASEGSESVELHEPDLNGPFVADREAMGDPLGSATLDHEDPLCSAIHALLSSATMEASWVTGWWCSLQHDGARKTSGVYLVTWSRHVNFSSVRLHLR